MKKSKILGLGLGFTALSAVAIATPLIVTSCSNEEPAKEIALTQASLDSLKTILGNDQVSTLTVKEFNTKMGTEKDKVAQAIAAKLTTEANPISKTDIESIEATEGKITITGKGIVFKTQQATQTKAGETVKTDKGLIEITGLTFAPEKQPENENKINLDETKLGEFKKGLIEKAKTMKFADFQTSLTDKNAEIATGLGIDAKLISTVAVEENGTFTVSPVEGKQFAPETNELINGGKIVITGLTFAANEGAEGQTK